MKTGTPHHYTQCGLGNVYLRNGFEVVSTKYGEAIRIHDMDGLHGAIGMYLIREKKQLDGMEIRFLRHEMDLSQNMLGKLLDKSAQSIARWEKGQTRMDGPADRLLRLLYESHATDTGRGHGIPELLAQLGGTRRHGSSRRRAVRGHRPGLEPSRLTPRRRTSPVLRH